MCLINKDIQPVNIADKDIICYKELDSNNESPYNDYVYIKGRIQPIVNIKQIVMYQDKGDTSGYFYSYASSDSIKIYNVYQGYHSRNDNSTKRKSHLFIIPKGTKYIIGGENIVEDNSNNVSETIIFIGRNNLFNRLKAKIKYNV